MKQIFARISMVVECTDEEYAEIFRNVELGTEESEDKARELFWKYYQRNHKVDGDCYLPANYNAECNPNADDFDL